MVDSIFYDPKNDFEYVSDSILWGKIFLNLFPIDINHPSKECINLSEFFDIKTKFIGTDRGYSIERKILLPKENFFYLETEEINLVFNVLCNFLIRFNRPFIDCYINLPNHSKIEPNDTYSPLDIYYKKPVLPLLNEKKDKLRLLLSSKLYEEIHIYCFGCKSKNLILEKSYFIDFSFNCFSGFLLNY